MVWPLYPPTPALYREAFWSELENQNTQAMPSRSLSSFGLRLDGRLRRWRHLALSSKVCRNTCRWLSLHRRHRVISDFFSCCAEFVRHLVPGKVDGIHHAELQVERIRLVTAAMNSSLRPVPPFPFPSCMPFSETCALAFTAAACLESMRSSSCA